MSHENPGAYREAQDRIRETKDREKQIIEERTEDFEKGMEKIRKKKKLDIFELKRRIETGYSLESLKAEMKEAYEAGDITVDTYKKTIDQIDDVGGEEMSKLLSEMAPLSQNAFAQYLESAPLGKNIGTDIVGFLYGFFVQGSAILVILAWKIFLDMLFLPRDIYLLIRK